MEKPTEQIVSDVGPLASMQSCSEGGSEHGIDREA